MAVLPIRRSAGALMVSRTLDQAAVLSNHCFPTRVALIQSKFTFVSLLGWQAGQGSQDRPCLMPVPCKTALHSRKVRAVLNTCRAYSRQPGEKKREMEGGKELGHLKKEKWGAGTLTWQDLMTYISCSVLFKLRFRIAAVYHAAVSVITTRPSWWLHKSQILIVQSYTVKHLL